MYPRSKEEIAAARKDSEKMLTKRALASAAAGLVPFLGAAISSAISYAGMKYLGRVHIKECVALATEILEKQAAGSGG